MGCCLGTVDHHHPETDSRGGAPPTSPPPPVLEEETVKEVLLETPVVAPKVYERIKGLMPPENQEWKVEVGPPAALIHPDPDPHGKTDDEEIVSEISEICSYSESFSNATAAQEKKLDDDENGVVNQRLPDLVRTRRGRTGGRGRGRGRTGDRVIARKAAAAPSPENRGQVAPLRSVRGTQTAGQPRKMAADDNVRRRGPGEDPRRRSRSPVRRGDEKSAAAGTEEPPNEVVPAEEAESLENPVVSLECFIFL